MKVVSINPWQMFDDLHNERTRLLNRKDTNRCDATSSSAKQWQPNVDIFESESDFAISVDLPGVESEAVDIQVDNNVLTVKGKREQLADQATTKKLTLKHRERAYGEFLRSFRLPDDINQNAITASFKLGILNITIEKQAKTQPKKIAINAN